MHVVDRHRELERVAREAHRPTSVADIRAQHLRLARARLALAGAAGADLQLPNDDNEGAVAVAMGPVAVAVPIDDGRGGHDVAVMTIPTSAAPANLSVRDGRTGRLRWSRDVDDAFAFDTARLGTPRRLSLVVYTTTFTGAADPTDTVASGEQVNSILALDERTGSLVWTAGPVTGTYALTPFSFSEVNALYPGGVLHDRAGDRVLGVTVSESFSVAGDAADVQPVVFDGATGTQTVTGDSIVGDEPAMALPAGDVDGDGIEDWCTVATGDSGSVGVTSGATASALWSRASGYYADAQPTPDLDGDRRPDLVVSDDGTLTGYAGRSGTQLFTRPGQIAMGLGFSGGRYLLALWGLFSENGLSALAIDGHGRTVWTRTIQLPEPDDGDATGSISAGRAADVDADGVEDLFVGVAFASSSTAITRTDVISGRSGRLTTGRAVGVPLGFSVDGHGADFLVTRTHDHTWQATAYDGTSRRALWVTRQTVAGRVFPVTQPAQLSRSAVLLNLYDGKHTRVTVIRADNGKRVWSATI